MVPRITNQRADAFPEPHRIDPSGAAWSGKHVRLHTHIGCADRGRSGRSRRTDSQQDAQPPRPLATRGSPRVWTVMLVPASCCSAGNAGRLRLHTESVSRRLRQVQAGLLLVAGIITAAGWLVFAIALKSTLNDGLALRGLVVCLSGMAIVGFLSIASRAERDTPASGRSGAVVLLHHAFCGCVAVARRRRELGDRVLLRRSTVRSIWVAADSRDRCRPVDSDVGWDPRVASRVGLAGRVGRCCGDGRCGSGHGCL